MCQNGNMCIQQNSAAYIFIKHANYLQKYTHILYNEKKQKSLSCCPDDTRALHVQLGAARRRAAHKHNISYKTTPRSGELCCVIFSIENTSIYTVNCVRTLYANYHACMSVYYTIPKQKSYYILYILTRYACVLLKKKYFFT